MSATRLLRTAARPHSGRVELAALAVLYGVYELVRGFGGENWVAARANTGDIVALERHIGVFVERDVQSSRAPRSPALPRCSASSTSRSTSAARPPRSSGCTAATRMPSRTCARR